MPTVNNSNVDVIYNSVTANSMVSLDSDMGNISGNIVTGTQPLITSLPGLVTVTTNQDFNVGRDLNVVGNIVVQTGSITSLDPVLGNIYTNANIVASEQIYAGANLVAQEYVVGNYALIHHGLSVGSIATDDYTYANGDPFVAQVSNAQIDTQIAAFLPTYTGPITANSVTVSGPMTSTTLITSGTVTAGNLTTPGVVAASGNISTGSYVLGNAAFMTGLPTSGNALSNVLISTYLASGLNTANIITSGNVQGSFIIGDGSALTNLPIQTGTYGNGNVITLLEDSSLTSNIITSGNVTGSFFFGNISTAEGFPTLDNYSNANVQAYLPTYSGDIGNVNVTGTLSAPSFTTTSGGSGNISGVNYLLGNAVTVTGNVDATYFNGNGRFLTGMPVQYGNANVSNYLASGTDTANIITSGNVNAGNINAGSFSTVTIAPLTGYTAVDGTTNTVTFAAQATAPYAIGSTITVSGAIIAGLNGTWTVTGCTTTSVTWASTYFDTNDWINSGSVSGSVSVQGNISGSYILGNGRFLTGLPAGYSNADVSNYLSSGAADANIITSGNVLATAFETSKLALIGNVIGSSSDIILDPATDAGQLGNVTILGNLAVIGNVSYISADSATTANLLWVAANNAATASEAEGGGLQVGPAGSVYASLTYDSINDQWVSSLPLSVTGNVNSTSTVISAKELIGGATSANFTRFPNALSVISNTASGIQKNELGATGLVAEATGDPTDLAHRGVGAYGVGYTSGAASADGISGEAHVSDTTDTGTATGVRGYAEETHAGGINIGLYSSAIGGATNYALYMKHGDIFSNDPQTWTLVDNSTNSLNLSSTGKSGILNVDTTNGAEAVTMSGNLSVVGNVSSDYFLGNVAFATGFPVLDNYGNANVEAYLPTSPTFTNLANTVANNTSNIANNASNIATLQTQVYGNSNVATYLASGTISTNVSTSGNVFASYYIGDGSQLTNLPVQTGTYGNSNVITLLSDGSLTSNIITTGNATAGNYFTGGILQATGNVRGGNFNTAGVVAADGNVSGGNVISSANIKVGGQIQSTAFSGGNISWSVANQTDFQGAIRVNGTGIIKGPGGAASLILNNNGANTSVLGVTGAADATSSTTGAVIVTGGVGVGGNVFVGGNVTGDFFLGNVAFATGFPTLDNYSDANVQAYLPTYTGELAALTGNVTTTANIQGDYILGNGAFLTGLPEQYGNANVQAYLPTYSGDFPLLTGNVVTTAIISGSYIVGNGSLLTGIVATSNYGDSNVSSYLSSGAETANIITSGNISGAFILGDGSALTNLPVQTGTYGDSNVTSLLSSGTVTSDITTSGIITGDAVNATNGIAAATAIISNITYPIADGSVGQIISTDGSGTLAFTNAYGNTDVNTYLTDGSFTSSISADGYITNGVNNLILSGNNIASNGNIVIDPLNDASPATGNVTILGNLAVSGNITYTNIDTATTANLLWIAATSAATAVDATGGGLAVGPTGSEYATFTYNGTANTWNTNIPLTVAGNVTGNVFIGNGSQLTDIVSVTSQKLANGTSNVSIPVASGPIKLYANGLLTGTISNTAVALGTTQNTGGANSVAIGPNAISGINSVSIGFDSGTSAQGNAAVAIGYLAGASTQSALSVALGAEAGSSGQSTQSTALGYSAGKTSQSAYAVAIGSNAGQTSQGSKAVAIGLGAGTGTQGAQAVAIGQNAGLTGQGANSIAIGSAAGSTNQANGSIQLNATGVTIAQATADTFIVAPVRNDTSNVTNVMYYNTTSKEVTYGPAGGGSGGSSISNGTSNVSIATSGGSITFTVAGGNAGYITNNGSVALGSLAGQNSIGANIVAIGYNAGGDTQGAQATAIGYQSGNSNQGIQSTSIGYQSGYTNQGAGAVAVGYQTGYTSQGSGAIAMASLAGYTGQGQYAIALGVNAGQTNQGASTVAIGKAAGSDTQGGNAVAIGSQAGNVTQGAFSVAIGSGAGYTNQGIGAIAIGSRAGDTNQAANSIVINASGTILNGQVANTFSVAPVRQDNANTITQLNYNASTKEITYGNAAPVVNAYDSAGTSVPSGTSTKIALNVEATDSNGCFNNTGSTVTLNGISTPSYSFAPNRAGWYQVDAGFSFANMAASTGILIASIYKNGAEEKRGLRAVCNTGGSGSIASNLIYLNGTSDYLSLYCLQGSGSTATTEAGANFGAFFQAVWVRG